MTGCAGRCRRMARKACPCQMATRTLFLVALGLACASCSEVPEIVGWEDFKTLFNKTFASDTQAESQARLAFQENTDFITRHNEEADRGVHSFRCGVNHFSDMLFADWREMYLVPAAPSYALEAAAKLLEASAQTKRIPRK